MLVFIDESGDCGLKTSSGSSPYFVITAVIFTDAFSAEACDRAIDELRRLLKLPLGFEFHFKHCRDSLRERFLTRVSAENFRYHSFVVNKDRLYGSTFNKPQEFYRFATEIVCSNARSLLRDAKIVIDKNGDRAFRLRLEAALKAMMMDADGVCLIRKVVMEHSHSNNLLQLADMVCGAVAREFNGKSNASGRFREVVRRRDQRIQVWPK